jgi:hypothetical protein
LYQLCGVLVERKISDRPSVQCESAIFCVFIKNRKNSGTNSISRFLGLSIYRYGRPAGRLRPITCSKLVFFYRNLPSPHFVRVGKAYDGHVVKWISKITIFQKMTLFHRD